MSNEKTLLKCLKEDPDVDHTIIQQKENEIDHLVKDIEMLNEIFHDMSLLVHQQSDNVDHILESTHQVDKDTEKIAQDLKEAERIHWRTRFCSIL